VDESKQTLTDGADSDVVNFEESPVVPSLISPPDSTQEAGAKQRAHFSAFHDPYNLVSHGLCPLSHIRIQLWLNSSIKAARPYLETR